MSSQLRVDNIFPSVGTGIGIGTANGSVTFNADVTGGLNVTTGSVGIGTDITPGDLSITQQNPNIRFDDSDTTNNAEITLDNTQLRLEVDEDNSTASSQIRFRVDGTNKAILDSNGNFKIENGNLVFSTSGKGIDFSAASGSAAGSTSALLDDYEEGTWTPTQGNLSTWTSPTFSANYTKIGRLVYVQLQQTGGTIGWSAQQYLGGLPFAPAVPGSAYATDNYPDSTSALLIWTSSSVYFHTANASEAGLIFTAIYHTS